MIPALLPGWFLFGSSLATLLTLELANQTGRLIKSEYQRPAGLRPKMVLLCWAGRFLGSFLLMACWSCYFLASQELPEKLTAVLFFVWSCVLQGDSLYQVRMITAYLWRHRRSRCHYHHEPRAYDDRQET